MALLLVVTEHGPISKLAGGASFCLSALLGLATLDLSPSAPLAAGRMLAPLFAGLFGAPMLVDAIGGEGVPPQDDPGVAVSGRGIGGLAGLGTVAGAVVGYVPAISSAVAATLALLAVPGRFGARGFVVVTAGVNTANAIFALFALVAIGVPRTDALVAVESAGVPLSLSHLLASVGLSAALGVVLVVGVRGSLPRGRRPDGRDTALRGRPRDARRALVRVRGRDRGWGSMSRRRPSDSCRCGSEPDVRT